MTRRVSTRTLVAHHVRSHAGGGAMVALLVLVLAVLATAAPIALSALGDATLRDRLDAVSPTLRDVESESTGSTAVPFLGDLFLPESPVAENVWDPFTAAIEDIRKSADAPLPDVLAPGRVVTRSFENWFQDSRNTRAATVAFDPAYVDEIRVLDGRMPEPAAGSFDDLRVEVVVSAASAAELAWGVGEVRTVGDPRHLLVDLVLVGIFEAADPQSGYWDHVTSVLEPYIFDDGNRPRRVTGTAYAHPDSLYAISVLPGQRSTIVWYPTDADRIVGDNAEAAVAALNRLTAVSHPLTTASQGAGAGLQSLRFNAAITATIESALDQQRSTAGIIAMLVAGPVGVAAAVLVLGCRLILEGRRSSLRLLSARGASLGQLRALLAVEGLLVGLAPAVLGAAAVTAVSGLAFGATVHGAGVAVALAAGLAPTGILIALAPTVSERQARADLGRRGSRVRLLIELGITVLALVALALLFLRGYSDGVDPLLAATPLLLALVACLVTIRLYPLPLAAVHARARARAGLDAFLGSARALREPALGVTGVLALVVGVSVSVSSGVLLSTLQTGVADAASAQIGADMRVQGGLFTRDQLDLVRQVDGVEHATGISGADAATLHMGERQRGTAVFIVEAAELRAVQGDGPGMLPSGVSLEPVPDGTMPLVASAAAADIIGDARGLNVNGVPADLVGVTRGPVPVGSRENWIAIDASYAQEVLGLDPNDLTLLVRLAEDASPDAVAQRLRDILGATVRVDTADELVSAFATGPALQGVRGALLLATGVAALLSALAIVMTFTLAAGTRARVLALLRTLGATRRSASALALWEIAPPTAAALIAGTLFGALVPLVVMAAVDLRPFTGSTIAPAYALDPAILMLTLGGFVALALALTAVALLLSRRTRAAGALRTVEEG